MLPQAPLGLPCTAMREACPPVEARGRSALQLQQLLLLLLAGAPAATFIELSVTGYFRGDRFLNN
jgi:hypothetical protein